MQFNVNKVKILVTVPVENVDEVRNAICEAGAGIIGNYTYCSTSTKVVGTFIPSIDANPYIGKQNKMEFVNEEKLEVICDVEKVKAVIEDKLNAEGVEITEATSFKDDLNADSLDLFELVMALEDEFGTEIPSEDLEKLTTVGDVLNYLTEKGVE